MPVSGEFNSHVSDMGQNQTSQFVDQMVQACTGHSLPVGGIVGGQVLVRSQRYMAVGGTSLKHNSVN